MGYNTGMKIFKYSFTKFMTVAIYVGIALAAVAAGVNTYFVITEGIASAANPLYPVLQYSLLYLVAALAVILLVSLLISSYYSIDEKYFRTSFGIIKSKYEIAKIESIVLDRTTNKLSVYFDENTFIVIVVREEWYEKFISELLKVNPNVEYSILSKDNDSDEKKS